jgi:serine/threonine protein kinase
VDAATSAEGVAGDPGFREELIENPKVGLYAAGVQAASFGLPIEAGETGCSLQDIVTQACGDGPVNDWAWRIEPDSRLAPFWIHVQRDVAELPEQGWKIHVSACEPSAEEILRRVLPVLLGEGACFKLAASLSILSSLNDGNGGLSQVGKFITVYPTDNEQAVRLALALDEATHGLMGPNVPSDRPFRPGGLIHYRYGAYGSRYLQTPMGEILPVLVTPDGALVADRRLTRYSPPEWAVDPFLEAGAASSLPPESWILGGRYLRIVTTHRSARGAVHLAVDVVGGRSCILKQAFRNVAATSDGRDARDHLRHEADTLSRIAPEPRFPLIYDIFHQDDDLFLAMEEIRGATLESHVREIFATGAPPAGQAIISWARELTSMLSTVHDKGFIYRDLKSSNVLVTPEGHLRLVDFELACEAGVYRSQFGYGTVGYVSPQQAAGHRAAVTDDIYSLGAVLYFAATGAEPSSSPHHMDLLRRPLRLLNPALGRGLEAVIDRCLSPDAASRFPSMAALDKALVALPCEQPPRRSALGDERLPDLPVGARIHYRSLAANLADVIASAAEPRANGQGFDWVSLNETEGTIRTPYLNAGSAGAVLSLAELVGELGLLQHRPLLSEAALGLARAPRPEGPPLPGLYVGEAGIGAAQLRTGQVLGDSLLIAEALRTGRHVDSLPHSSPDLYNGTAGRLRFHLLLWDETGDREQLDAAIRAGERLLTLAEGTDGNGICWPMPDGYGDLSGSAYLGYAHGAAGIADVLLDLFEATGQPRFLATSQAAARWLLRLAVPVLDDASGLNWPGKEGEPPFGPVWCHGGAGIGLFFLKAAELDAVPGAADIAARAGAAVARGSRWAGPTQCHGLSGNIEFLLDLAQSIGDVRFLAEAGSLALLLEAFAVKQNERLVWPSDSPRIFTPDYMVGYAGVALCLLRLSDPERQPRQLCRRGFQYRCGTP